jgi:hypothetical protein
MLQWWAVATLALATAFVVALVQPGAPRPPPGFPVLAALTLTATACSLELAGVAARLVGRRPPWARRATALGAFLLSGAAGGWVIGRAPGLEVLLTWMVAPPLVGLAELLTAGRRGSWSALAFLAVAAVLVLALGPRWVERQ